MLENNQFPVEVFPSDIQYLIKKVCNIFKCEEHIVASIILSACGFSLSGKYQFEYTEGWLNRSNLWMLFIGNTGTSKTPAMDALTKPITKYHEKLKELYGKAMHEYITYKKELKKGGALYKETDPEIHKEWCLKTFGVANIPIEPKRIEMVAAGGTFEKISKVLGVEENNGRPLLFRSDEFGGFMKSFNQYHKGSDEEDFLNFYDYNGKDILRVDNDRSIRIREKTVSLLGSTQPKALFDVINEDRINNGMIYRILFAIDNSVENRLLFGHRNKENVYVAYYEMLNHFLSGYENMITDYKRIELEIDDDVDQIIAEWERYTQETPDLFLLDKPEVQAIVAKMRYYVFRIAIIINRLRAYSENTMDDIIINGDDMRKTLKIVNYFMHNIERVMNDVIFLRNRYFKAGEKEFYEKLPENFTYKEFVYFYVTGLKKSEDTAKKRLKLWFEQYKILGKFKGQYYKK